MTSQGTAGGRFARAIQQRNLWTAEISLRELGRLELEATFLSLAESQLALAALASLCAGESDAIDILWRLLRRVRPNHTSGWPRLA